MIETLIDLSSHTRKRLASAMEAGLLSSPYSAASLQAAGIKGAADEIGAALCELEELGITGAGARAWLQSLERALGRTPRPDLVWSGPEVAGLHARDTRRVYEELLESAERSIWASTYAFFDGPKAFQILAKRMEARPALKATLLLNIERKAGNTTAADQLVHKFADSFWNRDWPGTARPDVFYFPDALKANNSKAVLHAKAVITDDEAVFVTSANLTEAAFDRNIELGLLVHDRALAATAVTHFAGLIDKGLLQPLPGN